LESTRHGKQGNILAIPKTVLHAAFAECASQSNQLQDNGSCGFVSGCG
jgi:hypothetical protein